MTDLAEEWGRVVASRREAEGVTEWWLRAAKPAIRRVASNITRQLRGETRSKLNFLTTLLSEQCAAPHRTAQLAADIRETKREILAVHAEMLTGCVDKLEDASGRTLQDPGDIQDEFLNFYKNKFQQDSAVPPPARILEVLERSVSEEDNTRLDRTITAEEVLLAVRRSPRRKAPGQDGITAEFYAAAWPVIGESLTLVLNDMWQRQHVPAEMTQVTAPRRVKDFRPITLLDVDAKILARVLTARPNTSCCTTTRSARGGGEARTMSVALCDIRDALSALGVQRRAGCLVSIDFSGAFDAVRHDFLFDVLRRRGVRGRVLGVLQSMYGSATSRLRVNGVLTPVFLVRKSVRQGCPASTLLFSVILAPLLTLLERRLLGLTLASSCIRVSAYAEDAIFVLRGPHESTIVPGVPAQTGQSVGLPTRWPQGLWATQLTVLSGPEHPVREALKDFGEASGLLANPAKCGALAAGTWSSDTDIGFSYKEALKILGVDFYADVRTTTRVNWQRVLASIRGVLKTNAARALGLQQRAQYVQMYGLSKAWNVAQVLPISRTVAKDITGAARMFLWRGLFFTSPMDVCAMPPGSGGLGVPDVYTKSTALFAGRWRAARGCLAAASLEVLLQKHPLGEQARRVPAKAVHFTSMHATLRAAPGAGGAPARDVIRLINEALTAAAPRPVPRVVGKAPDVNWERVWQNVSSRAVPADAKESWWLVVHDLVATRHRLHRCNRAPSRMCPHCNVPDVLLHRLASCRAAKDIWRWARGVLARTLGGRPAPNILLQPDFAAETEERQAAAVWACATTAHYIITTSTPDTQDFDAHVLRSRKKVLDEPDRWPPALVGGLAAWPALLLCFFYRVNSCDVSSRVHFVFRVNSSNVSSRVHFVSRVNSSDVPSRVNTSDVPSRVNSSDVPSRVNSSDVSSRVHFVSRVNSSDVSSRVHFVSRVNSSDVPSRVNSSDVPSRVNSSDAPSRVNSSDVPSRVNSSDVSSRVHFVSRVNSSDVPSRVNSSDVPSRVNSRDAVSLDAVSRNSCNVIHLPFPHLT
ncbi:Transposon TX1 uncharacterized 149 kDa protein [Frankliniella fusca]|uniref:Transposon TX1 uncharacterized 149 kDa protein n=1 Tax=Frankliniella fusca TaxID=407009 RepID=A0AAE1LUM2_9NEOP|nr:Transposon TX1 uncharacterized 149 kDa protein [Frankliniella fusca]